MKARDRHYRRTYHTAAVLLGLFCAATGRAQEPQGKRIIADVVPQGNHRISSERIIDKLKTRPGEEYNQSVVDDDVRRLAETGWFSNFGIQVRRQDTADGKVLVTFVVTELPSTIQEIVYLGAKHIKPEDLDAVTGLKKGTVLNPVANQMARQAILRKYHEKGRLLASVDLVEGGKLGDTRVVFNITEGYVVRIRSIDFVGNSWGMTGRLRTQVTASRAFLGLLGGEYDEHVIEGDVAKLEQYYRSFGFQYVHVTRELKWDETYRYLSVIFHIDEGMRYRVGNVQVEGVGPLEQEKLLHLVKLHAGDWYNGDVTRADMNNMKDKIGYAGVEANIRENVYCKGPGEVAVHYEVQERPPATVGQIIIYGNDVTRDNVIRRQVPLYPGQILTYPDLRRAEANLARLGIFESDPEKGIRPTVTVDDSDSPVKDVYVHVQETHTGSLLFGVGVNSDAGLTGSIVLNERNFDLFRPPTSLADLFSGRAFRGAGQEFRIEAVPGTQLQRYTVSFREPSLFDSPYSLSVAGYYYTRVFNEYNEERLGFRLGLGRKIGQNWTVSTGLRVEEVGVHNVPFFAPETFQQAAGENFLVGLRAGVTRDTRDSYLRATEGDLVEASFEQCLGDFTFPLVNLEANKYWTVHQRPDGSGKHVLAARSQVSWAGSNTPVYERFYAGGFRSMRGFEFRGVGPVINGFEVGGDFMFLNSLEYQIPILANDHFYFVGFVDSGTVERRVEINDYRVAAGVGMRIVVPMLGPVPIALDFGFPIVKTGADRDRIFSFWVGFFN